MYDKLQELSTNAQLIQSIDYLLEWDKETQMPKGGIDIRAKQKGLLAQLLHKERTSKRFGSLLSEMIDLDSGKILDTSLDEEKKAALMRWREDYLKQKKLPASFVKKLSELTAKSSHVWAEARKNNAFKLFAPYLKKMVEMQRKAAEYYGYEEHPYDSLIDNYEPAMRTSQLEKIFDEMREPLIKLTKAQKPVPKEFLFGSFDEKTQMDFTKKLLIRMGMDPDHHRVDQSAHPFCLPVCPTDLRVTTHITESSFMGNIGAMMHEGGHALYEMGLPINEFGSPLGNHVSIAVHESQSKIWETCIGLSRPFWKYTFPELKQAFKGKFDDVGFEEFYAAINEVAPTFIRIYADEVTYSLHVMIRFEMEKALIEGSLKVKDVPEVWNDKMNSYLGIQPKTDREGCLQDVHWSAGYFGYFPTYALGNLYAAQLFESLKSDYPDWDRRFEEGELTFARDWLKEKIHKHGRRYLPPELIKHATGKPLTPTPFLNYLREKYAT